MVSVSCKIIFFFFNEINNFISQTTENGQSSIFKDKSAILIVERESAVT